MTASHTGDGASCTAVVKAGIRTLHERFVEPTDPAQLFADAWEGAAAALRRAGVTDIPPPPAFPYDFAAAADLHEQSFPALEALAAGRLSAQDLAAAALRLAAVRCNDCHVAYMPPATLALLEAWNAGRLRGEFGVSFAASPSVLIAAVLPGGPAWRAGVRRGQQLLAVNGHPTDHLAVGDLWALLDWGEHAPNRLLVRDRDGHEREVTVVADEPAFAARVIHSGGIGLLRFPRFGDGVVEQVRAALVDFEARRVRGWIIDLRCNTGGFALLLGSLFIKQGRLGRMIGRRSPPIDLDADGSALPFQRPLVCLVGPGSLSAAELFAGSLQAHGRATLVGERTAGCIGPPRFHPLPDGSAMMVISGVMVIGPHSWRLNHIGLAPDIEVVSTREDEDEGRDRQLETAVSVLQRRLGER